MIRNSIYILLYTLLPVGLIVLMSFAVDSNLQKACSDLHVRVNSRSGNHFIRSESIREKITARVDSLEGHPPDPATMQELRSLVHNIAWVEQADIYRTINGEIKVAVTLRDPLFRVINSHNNSFYIDRNGVMFPLSEEHTARVMLATGHINMEYSPGFDIHKSEQEELSEKAYTMHKLYNVARFIHEDPFWEAFIDHIHITRNGSLELTPKNGAHIIEFGSPENLEEKFRKLRLFYKRGLPEAGWHYYSRVNVKYNKQIVCKK
ncbi:MAG: hypothetical protein R6U62_04705 [Bacteroidales bacterium]